MTIHELRQRAEHDCISWQLLKAFMARRVKMFRTLCTVSIVFNTQLEAEEFEKLMRRANARKEQS